MRRSSFKTTYLTILLSVIFVICTYNASAADKKKIGVIMIPNIQYYKEIHKALIETLSSEGVTEDSVDIIIQKPLPDRISLMNTARKFAAIEVDVIVSYGAPSTLASVGEQSDIPVVFAGVFDPEAVGVSLNNATGVSSRVSVINLLKKFKRISNFQKLGILYSNSEQDTVLQADEVRRLGDTLGYKSVMFNIRRAQDTAKIAGVDALFITTSCPALYCINDIISIARRGNIPTATLVGSEGDKGIILSMAANPHEQGTEAAKLVSQVLKGANASYLPVKNPRKVDIVINVREASRIGLDIPVDLLDSTTKITR